MTLTTDQIIQVWNAVGTWVSGTATFCAVVVSLYLSRRSEKVRLHVTAGAYLRFGGEAEPSEDILMVSVTNLGDRPVRVESMIWALPRRRSKWSHAYQMFNEPGGEHLPKQLVHGERANFTLSDEEYSWSSRFAGQFLRDLKPSEITSVRLIVVTSVNQSIKVKLDKTLVDRLKEAHGFARKQEAKKSGAK